MKLNKHELGSGFDIDGTLILHNHESYPQLPKITLNYYGHPKIVAIHTEHVQLLKSYKKRGYFVRVHSANGWAWVKEVVEKLGLTDFVDEGETKLTKYVDDLDPEGITGRPIYIPVKKYD